jgi:Uma2 family endonuclease
MPSAARQPHYTPEEYLALERKAGCKNEYINGQVLAMAGASRMHNLIAGNFYRETSQQLRGRPCEAYISDMRVKVSQTGLYTYPDVVVVCGEIRERRGDLASHRDGAGTLRRVAHTNEVPDAPARLPLL